MSPSEFAEVIQKLNEGVYVGTALLTRWRREADDMAMTMLRVPAYELVSRDLERLATMAGQYLHQRKQDPTTAREFEARITRPPLSERV